MSDELDYHEKHAGEFIKDPWDDNGQKDWPNRKIEEVTIRGNVVGTDEGSEQLPESG
jgi:hypothetical protein